MRYAAIINNAQNAAAVRVHSPKQINAPPKNSITPARNSALTSNGICQLTSPEISIEVIPEPENA
jgi:hypothetical protein